MKIIIVEGTDRTGKDTLINELKNLENHTLIVHCGKPTGDTVDKQNWNQDILFNDYLNMVWRICIWHNLSQTRQRTSF